MLTRTSRTLISKLGPSGIRNLNTYIPIPLRIQSISKQTPCRLRYSSAAFLPALEEPETTASPPVPLPQELFQLARKVEESLEERLFFQFFDLYSSFRLVALDCSRNPLIPTSSLLTLFPSLHQFYDTAQTRLSRSPSKEHAALHVMMYKDAFIIYRNSLSLKHPLLFASELFGSSLDRNAFSIANNAFEHIKHLICMLPPEVNVSLSLETMENWMEKLGSSSDPSALTLLQHMVLSLPHCTGIQPSRKHHHCVIKALLKAHQAGRAWRWLEKMQFQHHALDEGQKRHWWTKLPHLPWFNSDDPIPPSSSISWTRARTQDHDLFLTYFAKSGDFMSAQLLMKQMFILGPPILPGQRSWHLYLLAAVSQSKSTVSSVIKEMSEAGFKISLTILASLSGRGDLQSWVSEDILSLLRSEESQEPDLAGEGGVADLLPDFKPDPLRSEIRTVEVKFPPHLKRLPSHNIYAASGADGGLTDLSSDQAHALPASEEFGLSVDPFHVAFERPVLEKLNSTEGVCASKGLEEPQVVSTDPQLSSTGEVSADKLRRNLLKMAQTPNLVNTIRSYDVYISLPGSKRFDIELGSALIRGLCRNTLKVTSKRNVLQAVKMYKGLLASNLRPLSPSFFTPSSTDEIKDDPSKELKHVYYMLLRNLTAPHATYSSGAEAVESQERCLEDMHYLLNEMKTRGITLDSRLIAPIILLKWRSIGNHDEALQFYISFISDIESSRPSSDTGTEAKVQLMDLGSFRSILNSFGQLSFQNAHITPARLWHVLLSHIRARGYTSTSKDYALYINNLLSKNISPLALRYASLGMDPPEEEENMVKSMYDSLKYLFRQITIDIYISPDAVLFNTLMDAFQRVGAFDDALQVFNLGWLTGRVDNVTPIIMFDACGHAKRPVDAYLIWNMLVRRRWKFDKRTLDTWVECLCRLGYVDQACKFVCLYMGKEPGEYETVGDTNPDINTCLILLRFSWNFGQSLEVREKIKSHLPHIWQELSARYM